MIEVLSSGALNTVQDLGRYGYRKIGVAVAGAMDRLALAAGNLLLGNPVNCAGIEVTMFPFRVRFQADATIAITGADCAAELDGKPLLPWWTVAVRRNQVLSLSMPTRGCRAYLAVRGGIDVPLVLNSRSTDLKSKFGGRDGRSLKRGDLLALLVPEGKSATDAGKGGYGLEPPQLALPLGGSVQGTVAVRVLPGAEYEIFPQAGHEQFWNGRWLVTPNSNRQGYRLAGPALPMSGQSELLSHGLVPGTIQVPPSGQPIIQMSDANTSGGYPKIGTVIEADMWRLAQARVADELHFVQTTVAEAVAALAAERAWLRKIEVGVAALFAGSRDKRTAPALASRN
jgi:biotin-dependent carboxylase-like uncharacterized protein